MLMKTRRGFGKTGVGSRISRLLLTMIGFMIAIIVALLALLISVNGRYSAALTNANTAADFNKEFKDTIDLKMYVHVIRPRSDQSARELPMSELDDAVGVLHRLEVTTTLRDNRWRIKSMLNMCENLRAYMYEIAASERYDDRMELLERNIRGETGLTVLIETYMHEYLDDEVRELARLQKELSGQTSLAILLVVSGVIALTALMLSYSVRLARRITAPISELALKTRRFGEGVFSSAPLETDIAELQTLDAGFIGMAERINALMEKQKRDQQYLHRAELELLQAQINPHFLYNTLDSIAILAEMRRNEDVVTMVTMLSVFFRNSLSKGKDIITLREEREHVRSYLEIQQIRYSDRFTYEMDIPEELLDCLVPKLILQPLVENALYHGIKSKRAMGKIGVIGRERDGDILISVTDNGAGISEALLQKLRSGVYEDNHTGLGLVNVHKRVRLYCGDRYGLTFESEQGVGSTVSILLPRDMPPLDGDGKNTPRNEAAEGGR